MPALRLHIGAKHGVHARQIALPLLPEPGEHIGIDPQVNRLFALRHHESRLSPFSRDLGIRIGVNIALKLLFAYGVGPRPVGPVAAIVTQLSSRNFPFHLSSLRGRRRFAAVSASM